MVVVWFSSHNLQILLLALLSLSFVVLCKKKKREIKKRIVGNSIMEKVSADPPSVASEKREPKSDSIPIEKTQETSASTQGKPEDDGENPKNEKKMPASKPGPTSGTVDEELRSADSKQGPTLNMTHEATKEATKDFTKDATKDYTKDATKEPTQDATREGSRETTKDEKLAPTRTSGSKERAEATQETPGNSDVAGDQASKFNPAYSDGFGPPISSISTKPQPQKKH